MATAPPVELQSPPDQGHNQRLLKAQLARQESSSNSTYNTGKSNLNGASAGAISDEQWRWVQKITSQVKSGDIRVIPSIGDDTHAKDIPTHQISNHSIGQTQRSKNGDLDEIASGSNNGKTQIRRSYDNVRINSINVTDNNDQSASSGASMDEFADQKSTGEVPNSGEGLGAGNLKQIQGQSIQGNIPDPIGSKIPVDIEPSDSNLRIRVCSPSSQVQKADEFQRKNEENSQEDCAHNDQGNEIQAKTPISVQANSNNLNLQNFDELPVAEKSDPVKFNEDRQSQKDHQIEKNENHKKNQFNYTNQSPKVQNSNDPITVQDSEDEKEKESNGKKHNETLSQKANAGMPSNSKLNDVQLQDNAIVQVEKKDKQHANDNNQVHEGQDSRNSQVTKKPNSENHEKTTNDAQQPKHKPYIPNNNPLKVSSNFETFKANSSKPDQNKAQDNKIQTAAAPKNPNQNKFPNTNIPNPPNPIVPHVMVTRLRAQEAMKVAPINICHPKITTKQGYPAVVFKKDDFMVKLVERCKYTLIGKFTNTMPKMEVIRKEFILQTELRGGVKLTHFNSRHLYIDLDNEYDHSTVWSKGKMYIEGQIMRLQIWTPTFKPEVETP